MSELYWLTDEQMARLVPYFSKSHGKPRVDDRRVLSGIVFVNPNGLRWCDAPSAYGPYKTLYNRWKRWGERGVYLLCAGAGDGRHAGADGGDRRLVPGSSMVRQPPDSATPVPPRSCGRSSAGAAADDEDGACAHLTAPTDERSAPRAPDLPVPAARS